MFRHQGKKRTFKHNLRSAALLSFIAGIVNICGVLNLGVLTTNVTGHFAFFAEQVMLKNYSKAISFLVYILSFLLGAFFASIITEFAVKKRIPSPHKFAILFEIGILLLVGLLGASLNTYFQYPLVASLLLFAMGMQNSLVTQISNSTVRTTHLTGLFTDLGIELSQLFFYRESGQRARLNRSIQLRLSIIGCFFGGCVIGGGLYSILSLKTVLVGTGLLVIALVYDTLLLQYHKISRARKGRIDNSHNFN